MTKDPPMRDRRDVGQVIFLSEKMAAAREMNTNCVGADVSLETNRGFGRLLHRIYGSKRGENPTED